MSNQNLAKLLELLNEFIGEVGGNHLEKCQEVKFLVERQIEAENF